LGDRRVFLEPEAGGVVEFADSEHGRGKG
jgi:hypothetical protein